MQAGGALAVRTGMPIDPVGNNQGVIRTERGRGAGVTTHRQKRLSVHNSTALLAPPDTQLYTIGQVPHQEFGYRTLMP